MMPQVRRTFRVRRIVVAADSSSHCRAALEAAATLGARLHAEVEGLFVEDINLVNLGDLTVGREVHLISGHVRVLDRAAMEDELHTDAARARRTLETVARRVGVRSTFRVVRGRVEAEIITAAGEADLLILGRASRPIGSRRRLGSIAMAAVEKAPRSILLLRAGAMITGRFLVAYDGSEGSEVALDAAVSLAGDQAGVLIVLLVAETPPQAAQLEARVETQLGPREPRPRFLRIPKLELNTVCDLLTRTKADLLVLSADSPVLTDRAHGALLEQIRCPILLVR